MDLDNQNIAFVATNGVEQVELTQPWDTVKNAGGRPSLISSEAGEITAFNHLDKADKFTVDLTAENAQPDDYAGLVLPGGVANPDFLRTDPKVVGFISDIVGAGTPVAVICHGSWTLVEADVVRGRTMTSWPSLQTDLRNAGAIWVDEPVQVCNAAESVFVSSRKPDDLDQFCEALLEVFAT